MEAYPHLLDAVVLAGTHRNPNRLIGGRNKALLEIAGKSLIRHVVDALEEARTIDRIFIVGPVEQLRAALGGISASVELIEQCGKMLTNSWAGIRASEARHQDQPGLAVADRPLLIISCDLPLVTGRAVDDFVSRCARLDRESETPAAMLAGVVDEAGVAPFQAGDGQQGIERPFVELACGRLRLANIYVARPRKMSHQDFLQTGFSYRKAKDWRNVVLLAWSIFRRPHGWESAWLVLRFQLTLMLAKGRGRLYRRLKAGNTLERVEKCMSEILGGPVRVVLTPFGGLSLDVDEEEDYRVLRSRYTDWSAVMETVRAETTAAAVTEWARTSPESP